MLFRHIVQPANEIQAHIRIRKHFFKTSHSKPHVTKPCKDLREKNTE